MPARLLDTEQVAELLGVSPRRVYQLRKEPDPPPVDADGKYPCVEFRQWYRRKMVSELGVSSTGEIYDGDAEKARLTFHQANIAALDEETKRKSLIPADVVKEHWQTLAANTRSKLLSLPGRLAVSVSGTSTLQDAEKSARDLIYEALNELAGDGIPGSS